MSEAPATSAPSDTRQSLIDAAIRCLMSGGWAALRMRDLAQTVGIRPPSIYHHFATKSDLGLGMVAFLHHEMRAHTEALSQSGSSLRQRLDGLMAMIASEGCSESCPLYNLQAEYAVLPEPMQQAVHALVQDMLNLMADWIQDAVQTGEIASDCDVRAQAGILLSLCEHGLQLQRLLQNLTMAELANEWYRSLRPTGK